MKLLHVVRDGVPYESLWVRISGLVVEVDDGKVQCVSVQATAVFGRERQFKVDFGRRKALAKPMHWARLSWERAARNSSLRVRIGLGRIRFASGVAPAGIGA